MLSATILVGMMAGMESSASEFDRSNILSIGDNVAVSEKETEITNVALGKSVTSLTGDPAMVTNGNFNDFWDGGEYPASFIIDLNAVYDISKFVAYPYVQTALGRYYNYEIYTSVDGENYTKAAEKKNSEVETESGTTFEFEEALRVRYIKVIMTYHNLNNAVHMREFEAYGELNTDVISAQTILEGIKNVAPTISSDGTKIVLPEIDNDDYEIRLYGSSNESVIGQDGTIYTPLEDMNVSVMYQVINKNDAEDVAIDNYKEVSLMIPGQYSEDEKDNERPDVVPGIREWKGLQGNYVLSSESRIVIKDESLADTAEMIAYYFKEMLDIDIEVVQGEAKAGDIDISLNNKAELGKEGYSIEIGNIVKIESYETKGALYAGTTITQILSQDENHELLPKGLIRDYPQYEVRAGMYDVARVYIPLEHLEEVTKYMAYFKLNEMHVHINDNGGEQNYAFRLESKRYPEINSNLNQNEVYSQDDYRDYQKEAKKFGIDVITEIDTPAHSGFVNLYDSDMMLDASHIDLTNENVVDFVKSLLDEYLDGEDPIIQSENFHIGTDEYPLQYSELARAYMNELIEYVNNKGFKPRMWGSLGGPLGLNGTTSVSTDAAVHYWSSYYSDFAGMINSGYKCINNWGSLLYIVPAHLNDYIALGNLYTSWEANQLEGGITLPKSSPLMLGAEAAMWHDIKTGMSEFDIFDRFKDQIMLMSEKNWYGSRDNDQTSEEFFSRIEKVEQYAPGGNPARYVKSETEVIASYDFEKINETTVIDNSNNGYDGQLNELQILEENGNTVLQLDGKGYFSLPFEAIGFPYTVSFDLYLDGAVAENTVLFKGNEGTMYLNYDGTGKIGYERKGYSYLFDCEIDENLWQNIMITCDNRDAKLYIDGIYVAAGSYYYVEASKEASSTFVLTTSEIGTGVVGKIDNIEILNVSKSYEEIMGLNSLGYQNAALEKKVEVSGLEVYDGRFTGEMAVDGDTATRISLNQADDAWFMVDLGSSYLVDKIEILWNERPLKYQILISEDGTDWVNVFEDLKCQGGSKGTEMIEFENLTKVRYVKYQQLKMWNDTQHEYSGNFTEFRVWAFGEDFTNILDEAKSLLHTTEVNETNEIFLMKFSENIQFMEEVILEQDIEEIAAAYKLLSKQVAQLKLGETVCQKADTAKLKKLLSSPLDLELYSKDTIEKYVFEYRKGIRAFMDMDSEQSTIDLAVRRIKDAISQLKPGNLALGKNIIASYGDASVINDGNYENYWDGGSYPANFIIDLGEVYPISKFVAYPYVGDNRYYNYEIHISTDGENYTKVAEKTDSQIETIDGTTFELEEGLNARYVKVIMTYNNVNVAVHMREFEVIGVLENSNIINTKELEALVLEVESMDLSSYTDESAEELLKVVKSAKEVLENEEADQETVDDATKALKKALEALEICVFAITKQPESTAVSNGTDAVVTVKATGKVQSYIWYYKNPGNAKFYMSGDTFAEGDTYRIPMNKWRDGQQVYCVINDTEGNTLTSDIVTLSLTKPTVMITKQPESVAVEKSGDTAVVTVETVGEDLTYTWYYKNPGNVKFYVSGETFADGNSYHISVNKWRDGQQVYCVITDLLGNTVQTEIVTLSIQK